MTSKAFASFALVLVVAGIYLFVNAPPALPEAAVASGRKVSARELLEICAAENSVVRELYAKNIVEAGQKAGLKFDERWSEPSVEAGPLPALFLRETAKSLSKSTVRLGLFLGSDFPIAKANQFSGMQAEAFQKMRRDRAPQYFFMEDVKAATAMFPDLAVTKGCVDCHNKHGGSPKRDWKVGDLMGATTWTVGASSLSQSEALDAIAAVRRAFRDAYAAYVERARKFSSPPEIGKKWPNEGYCLPEPDVFMEEAERRMSRTTLNRLLSR